MLPLRHCNDRIKKALASYGSTTIVHTDRKKHCSYKIICVFSYQASCLGGTNTHENRRVFVWTRGLDDATPRLRDVERFSEQCELIFVYDTEATGTHVDNTLYGSIVGEQHRAVGQPHQVGRAKAKAL